MSHYLLAQTTNPQQIERLEWALPTSTFGWTISLVLVGVIGFFVLQTYRKDTRGLSRPWAFWLMGLRVAAWLVLLVVLLNPQQRIERLAERASELMLLIDNSSSMQNAVSDDPEREQSRAETAQQLVQEAEWISQLQQSHNVGLYAFDRTLSQRLKVWPVIDSTAEDSSQTGPSQEKEDQVAETDSEASENTLKQSLSFTGLETRLGEALTNAMAQNSSRTLAGIVVLTDGVNNGGADPLLAIEAARKLGVPLYPVGLGGKKQPTNVQVSRVLAPTEVSVGDEYEITGFLQASGIAETTVTVELAANTASEGESAIWKTLETKPVTLTGTDPVSVSFQQFPTVVTETEYRVQVVPEPTFEDAQPTDNERMIRISSYDRPLKVLIVAGGPSWDYRFVRNALYRHPGTEIDVWLQSGLAGMSQEAASLRFDFPSEPSDMYAYDAMILFDMNWESISEENKQLFEQWVSNEAGGVIFVGGGIFTPQTAQAADENRPILNVMPVVLETLLVDLRDLDEFTQPWKLELTKEGEISPFMDVADDVNLSRQFWNNFNGFFRTMTTAGLKSGANVLAEFSDPRMVTEFGKPSVVAGQYYGLGKSVFIGSAETYRLRAQNEEYFERFWIKLLRDVSQGRRKQGAQAGVLLVDQKEITIGESVRIRARLRDRDFQPLIRNQLPFAITTPEGQLLPSTQTMLRPVANVPGEYIADLRATSPGTYRIRLDIPELSAMLAEQVDVMLPQLESQKTALQQTLLEQMAKETGGQYFTLDNIAELPEKIVPRTEQVLISEQLQTLWDRQWLLLLVVGLLCVEWTSRKLLNLA